jgi:hypothetical protein
VGSSSSHASSIGAVVPITNGVPTSARAVPVEGLRQSLPASATAARPSVDTALQAVACAEAAPFCLAVGTIEHQSNSSLRGALVTVTTPIAFACTTTITGSHSGSLVVAAGSTCLSSALLNGSIDVRPGAALHVTDSTITGSIVAHAPSGVRLCHAHIKQSVSVSDASGAVLIGDPLSGSCPGNYIGGSLTLKGNAHGVKVGGNQVNGTVPASAVQRPRS